MNYSSSEHCLDAQFVLKSSSCSVHHMFPIVVVCVRESGVFHQWVQTVSLAPV